MAVAPAPYDAAACTLSGSASAPVVTATPRAGSAVRVDAGGRGGAGGGRRGARSFTPAAASDVRGVAACGTLIRLSFCGIMQVELTRTRRLAFSE